MLAAFVHILPQNVFGKGIEMLLGEKLEILIERRNLSKTEFAESVGITYRGLANYLNGSRKPKKEVLEKICDKLQITPEFITDDSKSLILDSKERFVFNSKSDSSSIREAADYLEKGKVQALVAQPLYDEAQKTMEYFDNLFRGGEVPMWTDLDAPIVTKDGEGKSGIQYHRDIASEVNEFFLY